MSTNQPTNPPCSRCGGRGSVAEQVQTDTKVTFPCPKCRPVEPPPSPSPVPCSAAYWRPRHSAHWCCQREEGHDGEHRDVDGKWNQVDYATPPTKPREPSGRDERDWTNEATDLVFSHGQRTLYEVAALFAAKLREAEANGRRMGQGSPPQDIDWDEAAAALLVRLGLAAYRTGTTIRFLAHELRALREMPSLPESYVRRTEQPTDARRRGSSPIVADVLDAAEAVIEDGEIDFADVTTPEAAKKAQLELIAHLRDQLCCDDDEERDPVDGALVPARRTSDALPLPKKTVEALDEIGSLLGGGVRAALEARHRAAQPTANPQTVCAYCGQSEGHSRRCSVAKGLAPPMVTPEELDNGYDYSHSKGCLNREDCIANGCRMLPREHMADVSPPPEPDRAALLAEVEVLRTTIEKWDRKFNDRRRDDLKAKIERRAERIRDDKRAQWKNLEAQRNALRAALERVADMGADGIAEQGCPLCLTHPTHTPLSSKQIVDKVHHPDCWIAAALAVRTAQDMPRPLTIGTIVRVRSVPSVDAAYWFARGTITQVSADRETVEVTLHDFSERVTLASSSVEPRGNRALADEGRTRS